MSNKLNISETVRNLSTSDNVKTEGGNKGILRIHGKILKVEREKTKLFSWIGQKICILFGWNGYDQKKARKLFHTDRMNILKEVVQLQKNENNWSFQSLQELANLAMHNKPSDLSSFNETIKGVVNEAAKDKLTEIQSKAEKLLDPKTTKTFDDINKVIDRLKQNTNTLLEHSQKNGADINDIENCENDLNIIQELLKLLKPNYHTAPSGMTIEKLKETKANLESIIKSAESLQFFKKEILLDLVTPVYTKVSDQFIIEKAKQNPISIEKFTMTDDSRIRHEKGPNTFKTNLQYSREQENFIALVENMPENKEENTFYFQAYIHKDLDIPDDEISYYIYIEPREGMNILEEDKIIKDILSQLKKPTIQQ